MRRQLVLFEVVRSLQSTEVGKPREAQWVSWSAHFYSTYSTVPSASTQSTRDTGDGSLSIIRVSKLGRRSFCRACLTSRLVR